LVEAAEDETENAIYVISSVLHFSSVDRTNKTKNPELLRKTCPEAQWSCIREHE